MPPVKVLIVDDSAFVRKVVREILSAQPGIEVVGAARDGEEGLRLVDELRPDVVTCDLVMPVLDGVGFVRRQIARRPVPILILTASPQDADLVVEALSAGAVDFMQKPSALANDELRAIQRELVSKVLASAGARGSTLRPDPAALPSLPGIAAGERSQIEIVVLGISTGGPQALRALLPRFPADFPVPIAIVLHMPVGYTAAFADKLDQMSPMKVIEAKDGDILHPGLVLLAPAGRHLTLRRNARGAAVAQLSIQPIEKPHRPSVDVLFQSAAELYQDKVLGVVMTGMGDDGKQGAAWIKSQGGTVLTEAEDSCVIYGMPRSVVEAGLSDAAIHLEDMAQRIIERL
jgi:two-component system chemotaxis response regulator CheB